MEFRGRRGALRLPLMLQEEEYWEGNNLFLPDADLHFFPLK